MFIDHALSVVFTSSLEKFLGFIYSTHISITTVVTTNALISWGNSLYALASHLGACIKQCMIPVELNTSAFLCKEHGAICNLQAFTVRITWRQLNYICIATMSFQAISNSEPASTLSYYRKDNDVWVSLAIILLHVHYFTPLYPLPFSLKLPARWCYLILAILIS